MDAVEKYVSESCKRWVDVQQMTEDRVEWRNFVLDHPLRKKKASSERRFSDRRLCIVNMSILRNPPDYNDSIRIHKFRNIKGKQVILKYYLNRYLVL